MLMEPCKNCPDHINKRVLFNSMPFFRTDIQRSEPVSCFPMGPHQLWFWRAGPHNSGQLQGSFKGATHKDIYIYLSVYILFFILSSTFVNLNRRLIAISISRPSSFPNFRRTLYMTLLSVHPVVFTGLWSVNWIWMSNFDQISEGYSGFVRPTY